MYDNEGNICGIRYYSELWFFQKNLQGDIIAIKNQKGEIVARYRYDAWGVPTIVEDITPDDEDWEGDGLATVNPFRYRGYYYDNETGLYYLQSRYYDPTIGRFINADCPELCVLSKITPCGGNLFAYCFNNPCNNSDTTGFIAGFDDLFFILAGTFIGLCFALIGIIQFMSTNEFKQSWNSFCVSVGNGLSWIGTTIVNGGKAVWDWTKAQVKAAINAITVFITIAQADAKIKRNLKRNTKNRYWTCTLKPNYVDLGRPISYGQAVNEVSRGNNVFTVTRNEAKAVAKAAYSNKTPVGPEIDNSKKDVIGYYYHFHVYGRKRKGHVFFLFW